MRYPASLNRLLQDLQSAPAGREASLARRLIEGAAGLDLHKAQNLGLNFKLKGVARDADKPVFVEDAAIKGADWADDPDKPLKQGESWNDGRRATNTGMRFTINGAGHPQNPYMPTGLTGRGVLGQYGPNHAVDNGVLVIRPDARQVPTLYALGILRKFDGDAPAFSGGFAKFNAQQDGRYTLDADTIIDSQVEEFFEEMISGSVPLLTSNAAKVIPDLRAEINKRQAANGGTPLPETLIAEIKGQIETHYRLEQVRELDPHFLTRLRQEVANARECFAGPVLNDNRSTDNAWIETRLNWFVMDDATWARIKGDNPAFDYQLSAGDDASGVVAHRFDGKLAKKAFASHGPMFAFMAASFLLDAARHGRKLPAPIMGQLDDMANSLAPYAKPQALPRLGDVPKGPR